MSSQHWIYWHGIHRKKNIISNLQLVTHLGQGSGHSIHSLIWNEMQQRNDSFLDGLDHQFCWLIITACKFLEYPTICNIRIPWSPELGYRWRVGYSSWFRAAAHACNHSVQIACDVIRSGGFVGGPYIPLNQQQSPVELVFCNPDLIWRSDFNLPRLGQGAFRVAFQAVFRVGISFLILVFGVNHINISRLWPEASTLTCSLANQQRQHTDLRNRFWRLRSNNSTGISRYSLICTPYRTLHYLYSFSFRDNRYMVGGSLIKILFVRIFANSSPNSFRQSRIGYEPYFMIPN